MKVSLQSGVCLALNVICAGSNIIVAPQTFAIGFAVGVIMGLGHNLYLRQKMLQGPQGNINDTISKTVKKLNPFPGPLATFVAYVAMKVNEYGIPHLPFYSISLLAGVPLGFSAGKALGIIPWALAGNKTALAKVTY